MRYVIIFGECVIGPFATHADARLYVVRTDCERSGMRIVELWTPARDWKRAAEAIFGWRVYPARNSKS
jgi:hypothetical protein